MLIVDAAGAIALLDVVLLCEWSLLLGGRESNGGWMMGFGMRTEEGGSGVGIPDGCLGKCDALLNE